MKNQFITFVIGGIIGAALGCAGACFVEGRYQVTSDGLSGIKLDRWTGESWVMRYYEDKGSRDFFWETLELK